MRVGSGADVDPNKTDERSFGLFGDIRLGVLDLG